jgi:hypothetical protein
MRIALAAALALPFATSAHADPGKLDMTAFFTGRSHADNTLKVAFKGTTPLIVDSVGGTGDKGDFVLIDTVHEGTKPVRQRKWVMRQIAPGHFTGSLSDATGPVDIVVSGNTATVRYTMKGGINIVQTMKLQPDGRTLSNHVEATKFGLHFGRVDGTIRKLD